MLIWLNLLGHIIPKVVILDITYLHTPPTLPYYINLYMNICNVSNTKNTYCTKLSRILYAYLINSN